jgi:hypothetical protein
MADEPTPKVEIVPAQRPPTKQELKDKMIADLKAGGIGEDEIDATEDGSTGFGPDHAAQDAAFEAATAPPVTPVEKPAPVETPAPAAAPAPKPEEKPAPAAAPVTETPAPAAAVEAVIDDIWKEAVDAKYLDDDGVEVPIIVPKQFADRVGNALARRAVMDRNNHFLGKHRQNFEAMFSDGSIDNVMPVIELGNRDVEFRNYVLDGARRRMAGLPLTQAIAAEAQRTVATPPARPKFDAAAEIARIDADEEIDEYTKIGMKKFLVPMMERNAQLEEQVGQVTSAQQTVAAADQERQAGLNALANAHRELVEVFPGEFTGNAEQDGPKVGAIYNYAMSAGYFRRYADPATGRVDARQLPIIFIKAKRAMEADVPAIGVTTPAAAATATAVATPPSTLASVTAQAIVDARRRAAQEVGAAAVGGSSTSTPPSTQREAFKALPIRKTVNGQIVKRSVQEIGRDVAKMITAGE